MEHAKKMEAEFVTAEVKGISADGDVKKISTDKGDYEAKTVILATGADHRKLGVPGEQELGGMGVSYCATCDGAFFRGKTVAVAGGGDVALEDALFLARGCSKVYLIHRRDEFRGAKVLQEQVKKPKTSNWYLIPLSRRSKEKDRFSRSTSLIRRQRKKEAFRWTECSLRLARCRTRRVFPVS